MSERLVLQAMSGLPSRLRAAVGGHPTGNPGGARGIPGGLRDSGVLPAISAAAHKVGVDFQALLQTARVESGLNPQAKARTSSATGLFQFIDSTWLSALRRHGAKYGLAPKTRDDALALRKDPQAASLIAAEHMAENRQFLERRLGRPAGATDLYLAHFLGAGGAARFLSAMATDGDRPAATLFPKAAAANRAIFYRKGAPRSLQDVHALFARKMGEGTATPASVPSASSPRVSLSVAPVQTALPPHLAVQLAALRKGAAISDVFASAPARPAGEGFSPALFPSAGPASADLADLPALMLARALTGMAPLAGMAPDDFFGRSAASPSGMSADEAARIARLLLAGIGG